MKKWKIRVLHLSHTDIGYKDIQSKILVQQSENLLDVINNLENNKKLEDKWKWNIECFGTLEHFLKTNPNSKDELIKLIDDGMIGVSANYWGFTKLPGRDLLDAAFGRVAAFSKHLKKPIRSLITNDINGYSACWAEEANKHGVENLFFGLHTHHGFYPAFRKQYPFWWELPNGKKSLVWIGEQYAFGNNMGIVPGPMSDYIAKDTLTCGSGEVEFELANKRIQEYINRLEKDGYAFDIIPISTLGTGADNDPANYDIKERCERLEKEWSKYGVTEVKMVTLDEFFEEIRNQKVDIPTYKGEWPDWWTDGAASMPQPLRAFREAQRIYKMLKATGKVDSKEFEKIETDLLLYSEHTYGSEDPIQYGHSQYNFTIEKIKSIFALNPLNELMIIRDTISNWKSHRQMNEKSIVLKVINPFDAKVTKSISVNKYLGWSEADLLSGSDGINICDEDGKLVPYSIEIHPHPSVPAWSGKEIVIHVSMEPKSEKSLIIDLSNAKPKATPMTHSFATVTAEWADDVENRNEPKTGISFINNVLKTKYYDIEFDEKGIKQIFDKTSGNTLINEEFDSLFKPVYFASKIPYVRKELFLQRRYIGKNRISDHATRYDATLKFIEVNISKNRQDVKVVMEYQVDSCKFYEIQMKLSNHHNRIDVDVNMNKDTEWSIESLFIALPFKGVAKLDYDNMYEVDKGQIPGTLVDYHSIQEGIEFNSNLLVSQLDAALVWTGPFTYGERSLAGNVKHDWAKQCVYTWALNNVWETNFPADTSGFHCFRYLIQPKQSSENSSEKLKALSTELIIERK